MKGPFKRDHHIQNNLDIVKVSLESIGIYTKIVEKIIGESWQHCPWSSDQLRALFTTKIFTEFLTNNKEKINAETFLMNDLPYDNSNLILFYLAKLTADERMPCIQQIGNTVISKIIEVSARTAFLKILDARDHIEFINFLDHNKVNTVLTILHNGFFTSKDVEPMPITSSKNELNTCLIF